MSRISATLGLLSFLFAPSLIGGIRLDSDFQAAVSGGTIHSMEVTPGGAILIGGGFSNVNGLSKANLARLNADGSVDAAFPAGGSPDQAVSTIAVDSSGAIVIGGWFNALGEAPLPNIGRLLPDGSVDGTFSVGSGPSGRVDCVAVGPDGQVAFGGYFSRVNGSPMIYAGLCGSTGALDPLFVPVLERSFTIEAGTDAIAVQKDGKILLGGIFNTPNGPAKLVRLNPDGTLDSSFTGDHGSILYTKVIIPLEDGKILVAGLASADSLGFVRRLLPDGSVDPTFNPPAFKGYIEALAVDSAGRVLAGGSFREVNSQAARGLVRLKADGTLDPSWDVEVSGTVLCMQTDRKGNVLVAGSLDAVNGKPVEGIARLKETGPTFRSLATSNGLFVARLEAVEGRTYVIESSTDLLNWIENGTATSTDGSIPVVDEPSVELGRRFFRARLVE